MDRCALERARILGVKSHGEGLKNPRFSGVNIDTNVEDGVKSLTLDAASTLRWVR